MQVRGERSIPSWLVLMLLMAAAIAAHACILGCSFFSDDFQVLYRLGVLADLGTGSFFRPLPDWTLWLNYRIAGPAPWAFRIVNIALLGLNGWLVYRLMQPFANQSASLLSGFLFVIYPYHLEPQAWIIGRSTAMATAFILAALVLAGRDRVAARDAWIVVTLVMLGTLCYESALLAPLMLGAWWLVMRPVVNPAWRIMLIGSSAVVVVNLIARALLTGAVANEYGEGFFDRALLEYAGMSMKVVGRSFLPPHDDPGIQAIRFGLLGVALCIVAFFFLRATQADDQRRRHALLLITLFAVSSVIAIVGGVSTRTSESDRFLYLPSAFLCLGLALLWHTLTSATMQRVAFYALTIPSGWALHAGLENWRTASDEVMRIVERTPSPPANGRLLVWNLPDDHNGAFIFRHGYREALEFAGRDASRVRISPEGPNAIWEYLRTETGDTLHRNGNDRWFDAGEEIRQTP